MKKPKEPIREFLNIDTSTGARLFMKEPKELKPKISYNQWLLRDFARREPKLYFGYHRKRPEPSTMLDLIISLFKK